MGAPFIKTEKPLSQRDPGQVLQAAQNDVDDTITVNGFLVGLVGRRIDLSIGTTNTANDTEIYMFSENSIALYTLTIVYTDGTRQTLLYCVRTA